MPFTFSHPAIILPALKIRSSAVCISALVMGSMAPDFEYFIRMKLSGRFSHTLAGLFMFDLPVSLIALIVFHSLVKIPLINNLPIYFKSRLQPLKDFDFLNYLKRYPIALIACILMGTVSHIVWDGFTHNDGLFAPYMPVLLEMIVVPGLPELYVYRWLQHISTVIGAVAIFYTFHRMRVYPVSMQMDLRYWTCITFFFTVAMLIRVSFGVEYYGDTVVILISSGMIALICTSTLFTMFGLNRT